MITTKRFIRCGSRIKSRAKASDRKAVGAVFVQFSISVYNHRVKYLMMFRILAEKNACSLFARKLPSWCFSCTVDRYIRNYSRFSARENCAWSLRSNCQYNLYWTFGCLELSGHYVDGSCDRGPYATTTETTTTFVSPARRAQ